MTIYQSLELMPSEEKVKKDTLYSFQECSMSKPFILSLKTFKILGCHDRKYLDYQQGEKLLGVPFDLASVLLGVS